MNENNEYLDLPQEDVENSTDVEKFEYDNEAKPYRISQFYKISYDTNLSKDLNK